MLLWPLGFDNQQKVGDFPSQPQMKPSCDTLNSDFQPADCETIHFCCLRGPACSNCHLAARAGYHSLWPGNRTQVVAACCSHTFLCDELLKEAFPQSQILGVPAAANSILGKSGLWGIAVVSDHWGTAILESDKQGALEFSVQDRV